MDLQTQTDNVPAKRERNCATAVCLTTTDTTLLPSTGLAGALVMQLQRCAGFAEYRRLKPAGRMDARSEPREDANVSPRFSKD